MWEEQERRSDTKHFTQSHEPYEKHKEHQQLCELQVVLGNICTLTQAKQT